MSTPPVAQSDLRAEVQVIQEELARIQRTLTDMADHFESLWREIQFVRRRLASFYPERSYCPHCRAPVHPAATSCAACGKGWGSAPDPKAGQPR